MISQMLKQEMNREGLAELPKLRPYPQDSFDDNDIGGSSAESMRN